jgi:hypothetical protein
MGTIYKADSNYSGKNSWKSMLNKDQTIIVKKAVKKFLLYNTIQYSGAN